MMKAGSWRAPEGYISSAEAALRSGYTIGQIRVLAKQGRLLARSIGNKWLIDQRALDLFVANRKRRPKMGRPARERQG
jgi:hypothetical protein